MWKYATIAGQPFDTGDPARGLCTALHRRSCHRAVLARAIESVRTGLCRYDAGPSGAVGIRLYQAIALSACNGRQFRAVCRAVSALADIGIAASAGRALF